MSYSVPIHRPTSARHAIKLNFVEPQEDTLVVAKANRLEIYTQTAEGLALLASKTVYGYITMLERLRPSSALTDHLFVGTDRYSYFTCSWDAETKQLKTEQSYADVADKQMRDSRDMDRCHIDPSRRFMTLELYDGVVTVLPIVQQQQGTKKVKTELIPGSLGLPTQVRIDELMTRDSAFVQTAPDSTQKPRLAILWEDNSDLPQLKIRELTYMPAAAGDLASVDMDTVAELSSEQLDLGVSHLIPVSAPYGGFLILGERSISYVNNNLAGMITQDLESEATSWTCWQKVDDKRWLLADDYGRLYFLMISVDGDQVDSWRLDPIGKASKASALVYLDEGYVFVGSHSGDSQVVRIAKEGVEIVQTFPNIAPILDFSIMDLGRGAEGGQTTEFSSGQARIVTASGAWQDGSIRSVRSGVGMEEIGTIGQLSHITDLWALNSTGSSDVQDTLLVTFVDETRIFKFDSEALVEEVDNFHGLQFSEATLFVSNLPDNKLLQVHESGVRIADLESGMLVSQWKPPDANSKITTACANSVHLLVVEGGHTLHVFHTTNNDLTPTISKTFPLSSQISSVTLPNSRSSSCIVAFWQSASVSVLDLHSLEAVASQSLGTAGTDIPRSILVADVLPNSPPTLFIAMADGTVITLTFDPTKNSLSGMTQIILGSEPVFFKLLPRDSETSGCSSNTGLSNIFASCEQPSLIYASEGRIVYSAVNSDKVSRVCHFNCEAYAGAIAIATPTELKLAVIGTERATQLQTLPVGETVRCLAYEPKAKMFGVGCVDRILESGVEALMSSVKIADEVSFKTLNSYELRDQELVECIISTGNFERDDDDLGYGEMFIVGTSLLEETRGIDVVKGRIIVFEVNKERKLKVVTELAVKGACRSLAMCDGMVVAGLVKTVVLYGLTPSSTHGRHSLQLTKLATYRTSTNPLSLAVTPSTPSSPATIAVADLMKSLSILTLYPPGAEVIVERPSAPAASSSSNTTTSAEWTLAESARHFATVWSSAVACVGENEWLLADMEGNLVVLRRNINGVTAEDRRRLEVVAECRLGEVVNKIIPIRPPGSVAAAAAKKARMTSTTNEKDASAYKRGQLPRTGPLVTPTAFIATVEGGVYLHASIAPAYTDPLMRLQTALASRVKSPGHMPWARYRAVRTEVRENEESFRWVDGDIIEGVLGLGGKDASVLAEVVEEVNAALGGKEKGGVTADEIRGWAEALRRLY